jgi:predicted short-subunit dehydrogenase-like oxidoreductase (DUF2520 family)
MAGLLTRASTLTLGFVGSGRAGSSLARSLTAAGYRALIAEQGESAARLAADLDGRMLDSAAVLQTADLTFLAVPDRAIAAVAAQLASRISNGAGHHVVHLAGSRTAAVLDPLARNGFGIGALHPLQVLSGDPLPSGTTFAIEADGETRELLTQLVGDLDGVEIDVRAEARLAYHAAAVIAANLGMTLLAESVDLMQGAGIDRRRALAGLNTLMRGGLDASLQRGLPAALTGPVVRGDVETVRRHLDLLRSDPDLFNAYQAVSKLALRQARREGVNDADARALSELLEEKP